MKLELELEDVSFTYGALRNANITMNFCQNCRILIDYFTYRYQCLHNCSFCSLHCVLNVVFLTFCCIF